MLTPSGDSDGWGNLINSFWGKILFGHDIIDYVPRRDLWYPRDTYSRFMYR